jgi:hypothetical protein
VLTDDGPDRTCLLASSPDTGSAAPW